MIDSAASVSHADSLFPPPPRPVFCGRWELVYYGLSDSSPFIADSRPISGFHADPANAGRRKNVKKDRKKDYSRRRITSGYRGPALLQGMFQLSTPDKQDGLILEQRACGQKNRDSETGITVD